MEIEKYHYSDLKDSPLSILGFETYFNVFFDDELGSIIMPQMYQIQRMNENTVKIAPKDDLLSDIHCIIGDIEKYPYTIMIRQLDLLKCTISVIKKFSTTKPIFEFETGSQYLQYSFTLSGYDFETIFKEIGIIYEEIERNHFDDEGRMIEYFLSNID